MFDRRAIDNIDWPLLVALGLLLGIGLLNLYSVSLTREGMAWVFRAQAIYVFVGWLIFILAAVVDYKHLASLAYPLYWLVNGMLVYVLMFSREISGSKRWIELGPFQFQPSELAKVVLILVIARFFMKRESIKTYRLRELWLPTVLVLLSMGLIIKEPDLGTALLVGIIAFCLVLIKGVQPRSLAIVALVGLLLLPTSWFFLLKPYQKERVKTFLNPERDARGSGYHIIQSKIAIGSGKVFGKGYLENTQGKLEFLPKQHTDFIFANFAEEWGFVGSLAVLALYFFLLAASLKISFRAKDDFGSLVAAGVGIYFFWHIVVNIGMEVGLLPVVGVTLPFLSYGGSSLVVSMFCAGLLMNVSMRRYLF